MRFRKMVQKTVLLLQKMKGGILPEHGKPLIVQSLVQHSLVAHLVHVHLQTRLEVSVVDLLETDYVRIHRPNLGHDSTVTSGHETDVLRTVQIGVRSDAVVRQDVVRGDAEPSVVVVVAERRTQQAVNRRQGRAG